MELDRSVTRLLYEYGVTAVGVATELIYLREALADSA